MAKLSMHGGLDDWIRRRGIQHELVVPVLRNQILLLLVILFIATGLATETLWGIWFSAGFAVMTYIFYSWGRFFSGPVLQSYSSALIRGIFLHFLLRLAVLAVALYACLTWGRADPLALLAGVACGTLAPLLTLAWERCSRK